MKTNSLTKKVYLPPKVDVIELEMITMIATSINPKKDSFGTETFTVEEWSGITISDIGGSKDVSASGTESYDAIDWNITFE